MSALLNPTALLPGAEKWDPVTRAGRDGSLLDPANLVREPEEEPLPVRSGRQSVRPLLSSSTLSGAQ